MERIKIAVEKARRERELLTAVTAVNTSQSGKRAFEPARKKRIENNQQDDSIAVNKTVSFSSVPTNNSLVSIEYTSTKSINVAPETLKRNRIITNDSDIAVTSAYKLLRTQVLHLLKSNNWNSLLITSPGIGEGKTLTAINLAISMAREVNHTVLLVDLDLRRPNVARYFDLVPQYGIYDYLYKDVPLSDILIHPKMERFVVLPGRASMKNSSEMLSSPKMVRLVDEIKNRYPSRIIIFDMPPLFYADDVLAFSPYCDASLLILEEGKTRDEELVDAVELLSTSNIIGTVLNKASENKNIDNYY